jgi:murein L,D-transpeptidase YcbB/YkuD
MMTSTAQASDSTPPSHRRSLGGLAITCALTAGLLLSGCQKVPEGSIGGRDVDYAIEVLSQAPAHGFATDAFGQQRLAALSGSDKPADRAARSRELHAALVAYARAQHGLSIPKAAFPSDWGLKPAAYDAEGSLRQAVKERRFRAWLDGQPPSSTAYKTLQQAYVSYLEIHAAGGWPTVPEGPILRTGGRGAGVEALRRRLAFEDPALGKAAADAPVDADLTAAVGRFQLAHGLQPSGAVDAATLKELNVPAIARAAQIRANLERLRWLPREEPATRVDVNTAAATFSYFVDGKPVLHMLAASGKPGDETPMLASNIDGIVLNPPWNVPQGIAQEELYPKEAANPGYFAANGYAVQDGRLVQEPSADSALGLVKFEFDNPYSVYLHDTPSKAAFARSRRAVSHGCVRLAQALTFAKLLLARETGWSAARVDQVLASGETTQVKLSHAVPVRLLYLTAYPEGGRIAFRPDVYGWDAELLRKLDRPPRSGTIAGQEAEAAAG